jgi:hypothetical protein
LVSKKFLQEVVYNHCKEIMKYVKIGAPIFDGQNYALWSIIMKTFLQEQGFDVW